MSDTYGCAAFRHFAKRLRERVSEDLDPQKTWEILRGAMADPHEHRWLQFCVRTRRKSRRIWHVSAPGVPDFYLVYVHSADCPITVMRGTFDVSKARKTGWCNILIEDAA